MEENQSGVAGLRPLPRALQKLRHFKSHSPSLVTAWRLRDTGDGVFLRAMYPERQTAPNLFLVGFMGTGKSSLGRMLAQRWHRPFLDTDHLIEKQIKMPISEYFEKYGEQAFRDLERQCIEQWIPNERTIISCGGGLVIPEGMIDLLKTRGVVVCLFATPETILRRTRQSTHRPLLRSENPAERIKELLAVREPIYMRAGTGILTDGKNLPDLASAVERIYRRESRDFGKTKNQ